MKEAVRCWSPSKCQYTASAVTVIVSAWIGVREVAEHMLGVEAIVEKAVRVRCRLLSRSHVWRHPRPGFRCGSQSCDSILPGRRFIGTRWRALHAYRTQVGEMCISSRRTPGSRHQNVAARSSKVTTREECNQVAKGAVPWVASSQRMASRTPCSVIFAARILNGGSARTVASYSHSSRVTAAGGLDGRDRFS